MTVSVSCGFFRFCGRFPAPGADQVFSPSVWWVGAILKRCASFVRISQMARLAPFFPKSQGKSRVHCPTGSRTGGVWYRGTTVAQGFPLSHRARSPRHFLAMGPCLCIRILLPWPIISTGQGRWSGRATSDPCRMTTLSIPPGPALFIVPNSSLRPGRTVHKNEESMDNLSDGCILGVDVSRDRLDLCCVLGGHRRKGPPA